MIDVSLQNIIGEEPMGEQVWRTVRVLRDKKGVVGRKENWSVKD